jgi:acyl-CoA thioesterase-1
MLESVKKWVALALYAAAAALPVCAHSAPKTILVVGDSLSAEYGLARGSGWVALAERKLADQHMDAAVVNASISGETTSGGRARLPALVHQYHPAAVVIALGANDGLRGLPLEVAQENLGAMIRLAQQNHAKVLLVGMRIPPNYGRSYTEQMAAMYPRLAGQYHTALVPFMLAGVVGHPDLFQNDQLHPSAQAHPIILANIWPALSKLLRTR